MRAVPEVCLSGNQVQPAHRGVEGIFVPEVIEASKNPVLLIDIPIPADIQELSMLDRRRGPELRGGNAERCERSLACRNRDGERAVQVLVCSEEEQFVFLERASGIHAVGIHKQVGFRQG